MAFEYKIDKKQNILFIRFSSNLDDKLLLDAFNRIYDDTEYTPVMNQCINYSEVTDLSLTRHGVEGLVALCANFECLNTSWKTAIVARDDLVFGYGRMYQILCDGTNEEICVVRSLDAAMRLMGMGMEEYPFQQNEVIGLS